MTSRVTRRGVLSGLGAAAASGFLGRGAKPAGAAIGVQTAGTPSRVLALIGDRYHNSDFIRVALDKLFGELKLPVDYTINYSELSAKLLSNYRLFVCFRDGMIWPKGYRGPDSYPYSGDLENPEDWPKEEPEGWIQESQGNAVKEFVLAGNGFYAFHNSSHISLYSKDYREVMGGAYLGHPPLRPFKVRVVNRDHPITRGVEGFMVNDEQHYVTYDKDPSNILLRCENVDGLGYENLGTQAIAAWAYEFGKGRVVFTAPGHTLHAMWRPQYFRLQQNALRWLLKLA